MFKKMLTAVLATLLITSSAYAIDWYVANQVTVAWDSVTPIKPGDKITYRVYSKPSMSGQAVLVEETDQLQYTLTFSTEGARYVGVTAVRYVDLNDDGIYDGNDVDAEGNPTILESIFLWSHDADPQFGLKYFKIPVPPGQLRKQ